MQLTQYAVYYNQMDGIKGKGNQVAYEQVFVLAASNLPWDLDTAVLRRYAYTQCRLPHTIYSVCLKRLIVIRIACVCIGWRSV